MKSRGRKGILRHTKGIFETAQVYQAGKRGGRIGKRGGEFPKRGGSFFTLQRVQLCVVWRMMQKNGGCAIIKSFACKWVGNSHGKIQPNGFKPNG